jgi:hypothetical protein
MRFVNLTPHRVNIHCESQISLRKIFTLEPSGSVARVATVNERASTLPITRTAAHGECGGCGMELDYVGKECACEALGIPWAVPTVRTSYGEVTGLPDPQVGVVFIVSGMVASAAPREDVMSPGELVRDAQGRIIGCYGLRRSL